MIVKI